MRRRAAMGICVLALLALTLPSVASAQLTLTPTRFDDPVGVGCAPTNCTLRGAVNAPAAGQFKTIILRTGRYELTQGTPLRLDSGGTNGTGVTLQGAGARLTTIDGNLGSRVVTVVEGTDSATITDVTITGGSAGAGSESASSGGGIGVQGAAGLTLFRSAVVGNRAPELGGGIGADDDIVVFDSTISGNQVGDPGLDGQGAGIYHQGSAMLTNTTISGNVIGAGAATSDGGGIFSAGSPLMRNVTIAGNTATDGAYFQQGNGSPLLWNTIVVSDAGTACAGFPALVGGANNLDDDTTCQFGAAGDKSGVNPLLGPLVDNGGPTNTRALAPGSPALNSGLAAQCAARDQRGVTRPQGGVCDIGAFEYVAPRLTVVKRVVNDEGGTLDPGDFSVHVRAGAADVGGSPQPGTATGRTYVLAPGTYTVGEDADDRYTATLSGGCSAAGVVTLTEGDSVTCTITNADKPPVAGELVNAEPQRGTVRIKLPGRRRFRELEEGDQLPVGTVVDTLRGRVTLFAAANKQGGTAESLFYAGIFRIGQTKGARPITVLTLVEKLTGCRATGEASTAARKKKKRRLWGNGSGRFRTKGKHQAATIVGTKWLVEDRCTSTRTRVVRGRVSVRDFVKKKTVIVRAGRTYVTRQP